MPRALVALDLDGTLLDEASTLSPGHERAVAELRRLDVEVAIVTGRPLLTARWVQERLGLRTPLVCFNGGWLGHAEGTALATSLLDEREMRAIIAALVDEISPDDGVLCGYPCATTWVMDRETAHTRHWRAFYGAPIEVAPERFACWQGPSCKLMFVADPKRLGAVAARLRARFAGRFHVVISQDDRFEVSRHGITKAWGLERLAQRLGVARERVWAVGDAANDIEMIRWAGHGCAMGQAGWQVRRHARHVLPGITARGLCALPALVARHLLT